MSTFFERLKEERLRLGFNQQDFADIGGVQRRAQVNYENGDRSPDCKYLEAIANIGVNVNYVITGNREPKPANHYLESQAEHAFKVLLREADKIKAVNIYDKDTYNMLVMMFMRQLRKSAGHSEALESNVEATSKQA